MPLRTVRCYPVYFINGYRFHTEAYAANKTAVNSGVCITGEYGDYYGKLVEIIEIEYPALPIKRTVLFKCEWFDPTINVGVRIHNSYKLVDVNRRRRFNKFEPFILAMQATQVCFVPYPSMRMQNADWLAVCKVKPRGWVDLENKEVEASVDKNVPFQDNEVQAIDIDTVGGAAEMLDLSNENMELVDLSDGDSGEESDEPIVESDTSEGDNEDAADDHYESSSN